MNDVASRAAALTQILVAENGNLPSSMCDAVLECARDLLDALETRLCLGLLDSASSASPRNSNYWKLRLGALRSRALRVVGEFDASLDCARKTLAIASEMLPDRVLEYHELRVCEAAALTRLNRPEDAVAKLREVRRALLALPDCEIKAFCSLELSMAEFFAGERDRAKQSALEALVLARRINQQRYEGWALEHLGRIERARCRWAAAAEASYQALGIMESLQDRVGANISKRMLGITLWKKGNLADAKTAAVQCEHDAQELCVEIWRLYAALLLGLIHLHEGEFDDARARFELKIPGEIPPSQSRAALLSIEFLGDVYLEQGQAAEALRHYNEVWPKALALVPKGDIVAELRRRRAEAFYLLGRHDEAFTEAKAGLEHCRELTDRYEEAATYRVLALSAAALGRASEAKRWFDQGIAYYEDIETPYEWGKLWMAYGDWLRGPHAGEHGDLHAALEAYYVAHDHFDRMGARAKLAEANIRIAEMIAAHAQANDTASPPSATPVALIPRTKKPRRRPRASTELDRRSEWAFGSFSLLTRNRQVLHLLEDVSKLARSSTPILVLGESGTGKELVAGGIHRLSGCKGTYVPINCSALPREIIESELFGHMAGAFTGATRDKAGLFEVCSEGTVFLDEIAEMSVELQSRLLRFLETGESRRVGSNRNIACDTRIVAATNRDRTALERGEGFRTDLYYRLAHAVVVLPPLRARGDDVELLTDFFLAQACREEKKDVSLSGAARTRLLAHPWPGNVRQLRSVIKRVVILAAPGHEVAAGEHEIVAFAPTSIRGPDRIRAALAGIDVELRMWRLPFSHALPDRRSAGPGPRLPRRGGAVARHAAHHLHRQDEALRNLLIRPSFPPGSPARRPSALSMTQ